MDLALIALKKLSIAANRIIIAAAVIASLFSQAGRVYPAQAQPAAAPGSFSKTSPANYTPQASPQNLTLQWAASSGADSYEVCIDKVPGTTCDTSWQPVGSDTSFLIASLSSFTSYFWQVRATNASGTTDANDGTWWQFFTYALPSAFTRTSPADGALNQPRSLSVGWQSSGYATSYEWCYDTVGGATCSGSWKNVGNSTVAFLTGLLYNTTYYWVVRANNVVGTTYASGSYWWSFTTQPDPSFSKTTPANGATLQPYLNLNFQWGASAGATSYDICFVNDINDTNCTYGTWQSTGSTTSYTKGLLSASTTYYWQVRANSEVGTTYANNGAWWSFTTNSLPPSSFIKVTPIDGAVRQPLDVTLHWGNSVYATSYQYCYDTLGGATCSGDWIDVGDTLYGFLSGLAYKTTYYWQVRATNTGGTTYANGNTMWSFTTRLPPPAAFGKVSPANGTPGQLTHNVNLQWEASADAESYEVCVDETAGTTCDTSWQSTGSDTSYLIASLSPLTTYYWQVRAINTTAATYANNDTWWSFTTTVDPPGSFFRASPVDGDIDQPLSLSLQWGSSDGADHYEYCLDTTGGANCSTSWINSGASSSAAVSGLARATTYYWRVRAVNAGGTTYVSGYTWWSFTTIPLPPTSFKKSAPAVGATNQPTDPELSWEANPDAASYSYCVDTSNDSACSGNWIAVGDALTATPVGLNQNTIYYWQVKATNPGGDTGANGGAWWSFATRAPRNWVVTNNHASGAGSLAQAIQDSSGGETITFDPSLAGQTILLESGLRVDWNLTITGAGLSAHVRVSGNGAVRPFTVGQGVTAILQDLDVIDGFTEQSGGGVNNAGTLTITRCGFSGNISRHYGGGVYNSGTLTITASTFADNTSTGATGATGLFGDPGSYDGGPGSTGGTGGEGVSGKGGGIYNGGILYMENVTLDGNNASGGQGGQGGRGGTGAQGWRGTKGTDAPITMCAQYNTCHGQMGGTGGQGGPGGSGGSGGPGGSGGKGLGGGLYNNGTAVLTNVTLSSNNTACGAAGAAGSGGNGGPGGPGGSGGAGGLCLCMQIPCNCTNGSQGPPGLSGPYGISGPSGSSGSAGTTFGGGIYNESGTITFRNTLVASNLAAAGFDGFGEVTLQGPSLIFDTAGITLLGDTGLAISADPLLAPLADYGGPVFTRALLKGSPAIDSGSNLYCPAADARGMARPFDGNGDGAATCDLGAYEYYPWQIYLFVPMVKRP